MAIEYVGIDLAKNVFAVHGVDEHGQLALARPSVPRARLHELIASLPPCVIGMEACSGAHHSSPKPRPTPSAAGRRRWNNAEVTGKRLWPSPPRMRVWRGPCSPRARPSSYRPD